MASAVVTAVRSSFSRPGAEGFVELKEQTQPPPFRETKSKFTLMLLATVSCILLSSFQYGYTVGVVNAPEKIVRLWYNETHILRYRKNMGYNLNTVLWAITVSCYAISGLVGALLSGFLCERFGRKRTLLANNVPSIVAALFVLLAKPLHSYELMILARLCIGLSCGITTGVVPTYLAEISPTSLRGALGSTNQLSLTVSTLISQILGLPFILGSVKLWPILFAICAIPGLIQLCTLIFLPDSPRFMLVNRNNEGAAYDALSKLRRTDSIGVKAELDDLKAKFVEQKNMPKISWTDLIKQQMHRRPLIISCVAQIGMQLTGIGAVLAFSTSIFSDAGLDMLSSMYATCGISVVNVGMTLVSMSLIERLGRRTLFLLGIAGMAIFNSLITLFLVLSKSGNDDGMAESMISRAWMLYAAIGMIIGFVCSFAIGPGVIAWFISTEIFLPAARSKGTSIAMGVNWFMYFLTMLLFPLLRNVLHEYVFLVFATVAVLCFVYLYFNLPETKDRDPEEIAKIFKPENLPLKRYSLLGIPPISNA